MSDFNYYAFLKFKKNEVFALNDLTDDLKARVSVFFDMPNELPFKSRKEKKEEFSPQELLDFKNKSFSKKIGEQIAYLESKINWLTEFYFDNYAKEGNSILRPIHYPPITSEPANAIRAAAHGDINLITLLMGAQGKGLQVQTHDGEWIDAIAEPDELVINVGDMLSRHTNNKLKSTIHQVVNPPRELWGTSRYSIPFFMHPVSDMKLDCLDNCIDAEHPKQFEDITAGAYLYERLVDLGLIKK